MWTAVIALAALVPGYAEGWTQVAGIGAPRAATATRYAAFADAVVDRAARMARWGEGELGREGERRWFDGELEVTEPANGDPTLLFDGVPSAKAKAELPLVGTLGRDCGKVLAELGPASEVARDTFTYRFARGADTGGLRFRCRDGRIARVVVWRVETKQSLKALGVSGDAQGFPVEGFGLTPGEQAARDDDPCTAKPPPNRFYFGTLRATNTRAPERAKALFRPWGIEPRELGSIVPALGEPTSCTPLRIVYPGLVFTRVDDRIGAIEVRPEAVAFLERRGLPRDIAALVGMTGPEIAQHFGVARVRDLSVQRHELAARIELPAGASEVEPWQGFRVVFEAQMHFEVVRGLDTWSRTLVSVGPLAKKHLVEADASTVPRLEVTLATRDAFVAKGLRGPALEALGGTIDGATGLLGVPVTSEEREDGSTILVWSNTRHAERAGGAFVRLTCGPGSARCHTLVIQGEDDVTIIK